jgi:hypothetical protein
MPIRSSTIHESRQFVVDGELVRPLRPELYRQLHQRYGGVTIANPGEPMVCRASLRDGRSAIEVEDPGEYYRISCPFCGDTRRRLWINHMWGVRQGEGGSLNLFLAHCYNDNCLAKPGRAWSFYQEVISRFVDDRVDRVLPADKEMVEVTPVWPGRMLRVNALDRTHVARRYLESRRFDVNELAEDYNVAYCVEAHDEYVMARGRIVIPVFQEGRLRTWQARYVGDPPKGVPKYYNMRRARKRELLYNLDRARLFPRVVVVEGPTDVWRFGFDSVSLLGKKASTHQQTLLAHSWKEVVIVLDADARVDAERLRDQLLPAAVRLVELPADADPASLPRPVLRRLVLGE